MHKSQPPTTISQTPTSILHLPSPLVLSIIQFLQHQELQILAQQLQSIPAHATLYTVIQMRITCIKYYDRTDLAYYLPVCATGIYKTHRYRQLCRLACQMGASKVLAGFGQVQAKIMEDMLAAVPLGMRQQLRNEMQLLFYDPCVPMPQLLRETVAPRSCTPLHNYILHKHQPSPNSTPYHPTLQSLHQLSLQQQPQLLQQLPSIPTHLYNNPNHITYNTNPLPSLSHAGIDIYNILVGLYRLTDLYVSGVEEYVNGIDDQFQRYVELVGRFGVFEAVVIGVEENFGWLFQMYGDMCQEIYGLDQGYSYWKFALAMWLSKMYKYHNTTTLMHTQLLQQLTRISTTQHQQHQHQHHNTQYTYKCSPLYSTIENNPQQLLVLVNGYQEMCACLSVDQLNVLESGHSQQSIGVVYQQMENRVVQAEKIFIDAISKDNNQQIIDTIIKQRVQYLSQLLLPRTISQLLTLYTPHTHIHTHIHQQHQQTDSQIQHHLTYLLNTKPSLLQRQPITIYQLAFSNAQVCASGAIKHGIRAADTMDTDQDRLDVSFQFYESQGEDADCVVEDGHDDGMGVNYEVRLSRSQ